MKTLKIFKQKALDDLYGYLNRTEISTIKNLFSTDSSNWVKGWFEKEFKDEMWFFESNLSYEPVNLNGAIEYDFENAVALHESLPLTRVQAVDERLWAYLSAVEYWNYTQKRWPLEFDSASDSSLQTRVLTRHLLKTDSTNDRPFLRNSISRLWWVVEMTKDDERKDKYELTKIILSNTDLYLQIMERSFFRHEEVIKGILELFSEMGEDVYLKNRYYRQVIKEVNVMSGIVLLDFLSKEDFKKYVRQNLSA
ncbi:hypothetical protein A1A1_13842 [Planococcus antarcticus DSM 14505]|uniref:Uncharacterized protein n=1 Tax=Planococcus antarcticus DSM 14505 TaxID=1185653 RepID=A0AA87LPV5_9BACL|nr:DUF6339 family protein [Planococcus antarcticus]EIM05908.1 hypothetical protein A1A1_13842 [Planococcus antarcticus DSM 14505]